MKEIIRWDCCGQGSTEQYIMEEFLDYDEDIKEGAVGILTGWEVEEILAMKDDNMKSFDHILTTSESVWPTREYYIYYNYHCSSGFKTVLSKASHNDEIQVQIKKTDGFSLQAFWSEVIIFRLD